MHYTILKFRKPSPMDEDFVQTLHNINIKYRKKFLLTKIFVGILSVGTLYNIQSEIKRLRMIGGLGVSDDGLGDAYADR